MIAFVSLSATSHLSPRPLDYHSTFASSTRWRFVRDRLACDATYYSARDTIGQFAIPSGTAPIRRQFRCPIARSSRSNDHQGRLGMYQTFVSCERNFPFFLSHINAATFGKTFAKVWYRATGPILSNITHDRQPMVKLEHDRQPTVPVAVIRKLCDGTGTGVCLQLAACTTRGS